jgi:hypothetical protein
MNIRTIRTAIFAVITAAALSGAAFAQTGGSMAGPTTGGSMSSDHMAAAGCPKPAGHMSGGAMADNHMSGGAMADNHMADNHMSGGAMASGNHMATNCPPPPKSNP